MSEEKKQQRKNSGKVAPVSIGDGLKVLKVEKPEGFKTAKEVEKEILVEQENIALKVICETVLKELKETKLMVTELKKILSTQNDILNDMINNSDQDYSETQVSDEEMEDNPKKKKK